MSSGVNVTSSTIGTHMNVSGFLTSSQGTGDTATDDLTVVTTLPGFSKSFAPDSINLWGQRVNLLLDLAQLYQHQWERQYGRMASL